MQKRTFPPVNQIIIGPRCEVHVLEVNDSNKSLHPCGSFGSAQSAADRLSVSQPNPPPPNLPTSGQPTLWLLPSTSVARLQG